MPDLSMEPETYSVVLTGCDANRLRIMAEIREIRPDVTLKQAKLMIDNLPHLLKGDLRLSEAETIRGRFRNLAAEVEIRNARGEYKYEHYWEIKAAKPYPG